MTLRSLVNEGQRMRIALSAIHSLLMTPAGRGERPIRWARSRAPSGFSRSHDRRLWIWPRGAIEGDRAAAAELPAAT